jgi:DNA uptake protein ComE-like DNA-binding protein
MKLKTTALVTIVALSLGVIVAAAEPAPVTNLININTATEAQLKSSLGLGQEAAKKIVEGRPYTKKEQLKTRNIIPADSYAKIKMLIDSVC